MSDSIDEFRVDRTAFRVASFGDDSADLDYWLSRPPEERIAAVEMLRRMYHGDYAATPRLQRVFRVVERGKG
jgi:hypothetical protein